MKTLKLTVLGLILTSLIFTSCSNYIFCIRGEGDVVTVPLTISNFDGIHSNGYFDVVVVQGDTQKVEAVGHQNIIERLETDVHNGTWDIEFMHGNYCDYELTIYITIPNLKDVQVNGSGNIDIANFGNQEDVEIGINGSGDIEIDSISAQSVEVDINGSGDIKSGLYAQSVISKIAGSGDITLWGSSTDHDITIMGSGSVNTFEFLTQNTTVRVEGSGNSRVNADSTLKVNIMGSGNVYYLGFPRMDINISGSGSVISENNK